MAVPEPDARRAQEKEEESEEESEVLEESPCGRWQKRREQVGAAGRAVPLLPAGDGPCGAVRGARRCPEAAAAAPPREPARERGSRGAMRRRAPGEEGAAAGGRRCGEHRCGKPSAGSPVRGARCGEPSAGSPVRGAGQPGACSPPRRARMPEEELPGPVGRRHGGFCWARSWRVSWARSLAQWGQASDRGSVSGQLPREGGLPW